MKVKYSKNSQAMPTKSIQITSDFFKKKDSIEIVWLGNAGILINSYGTIILIDPILEKEYNSLIDIPLDYDTLNIIDSILITHTDFDHCSIKTLKKLESKTKSIHSTYYVSQYLSQYNISSTPHNIYDEFKINNTLISLTKCNHTWQNDYKEYNYRVFKDEDCTGYLISVDNKKIWLPADTRLLDEHLSLKDIDLIFFDFSNDSWHMGFNNSVKLANNYPNTNLLCIHWGSIDEPNSLPFNANPLDLNDKISNPNRLLILYPGEIYKLK